MQSPTNDPSPPERRPTTQPAAFSLQPSVPPSGRKLAAMLAGLMLTLFLAALDGTIVGTSMPRIVAELNGFERYAWVTTAYLLASTVMVPIVSKLSDIYGRKRQIMITISGFVLGSALCGAAQDMTQLIAFRALQGLAGGGLFSLVFSAVADIFPPAERAKWQGLFFSMITTAAIVGPAIGGFITEQFSWRWIFYVNVPICLIALGVIAIGFPQHTTSAGAGWRRIDMPGALSLMAAIGSLLLALVWGESSFNWLQPEVFGLLGVAVGTFALFWYIERHVAEPILPLDLFKNRVIAIGALASFLTSFLMISTSLYAPLYIQAVIGDSPTVSGLTLMPNILAGLVANIAAGQVISRLGRYKRVMLVGCLLMPLGLVVLALTSPSTDRLLFIVPMIVFSIGFSMIGPSLNVAIQNALPFEQMGVGTGALTLVRSVGQTAGAAVIGSIVVGSYSATLANRLPANAATLPPDLLHLLTDPGRILAREGSRVTTSSGSIDETLANAVVQAVGDALAAGIHTAFIAMAIIALGSVLILAFFLPDAKLRGRRPVEDHPTTDDRRPATGDGRHDLPPASSNGHAKEAKERLEIRAPEAEGSR